MPSELGYLEEKLKKLTYSALALARNYPDAKTFYLQTQLDKSIVASLENFEDIPIKDGFALKNLINRKIIEIFLKKSNLVLNQENPDLQILFNFSSESVSIKRSNIYIFANYLKKSREFAQHVWACPSCKGKGCKVCNYTKEKYPSLESVFKSVFLKAFKASDCFLHAAGREDVDVLAIGTGRPCVIEVVNPKIVNVNLNELADQIKKNYPIELLEPKYVKKFWVEVVCNSHFNKEYYAIVGSKERELLVQDFEKLKQKLPIFLKQRTPLRVVKRRSDLIRRRCIFDLKLAKIENGKMHLFIYAEAGTYIKEFIHGDQGRTVPSISSILNLPCDCEELSLIKINTFFLKTIS